jgi:hypothetical protein
MIMLVLSVCMIATDVCTVEEAKLLQPTFGSDRMCVDFVSQAERDFLALNPGYRVVGFRCITQPGEPTDRPNWNTWFFFDGARGKGGKPAEPPGRSGRSI